MEGIAFGLDYDTATFDSPGYLETVWGPASLVANPLAKDIINDVHDFLQNIKLASGSKQLDFGCGPSIHMTLSSSRFCTDIIMTEFASQNRRAVMKWLKQEEDAFDWSHLLQYLAKKENVTAGEIEKRTRSAIKEVLACNTDQEDPVAPARISDCDVITSCLCLEAACSSLEAYNKAIAAIAKYLKPGGYFILSGVLEQNFYTVKGKKFYSLPHSKQEIDNALCLAGFEPAEWKAYDVEIQFECEYDAKGYFTLCTKKK